MLGSAGGVGTAAVQIAKALGAKVIAMVHRPQATSSLSRWAPTSCCRSTDGWLEAVKEHTDGRGVDMVVDPIGGEAFDDAVRVLDTEGRLLVIGFAAGGIPTVKVNRLLLRNVSVIGVGYGEFVNRKPGSQSVFEFGVGELVKAGLRPPPPMRFPLAEGSAALQSPGRRWRARQGRAGAVMSACAKNIRHESPRALAFDVFGTVVDWRSSIIRELEHFGRTHGVEQDWPAFADDWRGGYAPAMDRVRRGELPWTRIDDLHRMILEDLLGATGIAPVCSEDIDHLNRAWHRLDPWPDSVRGLTRLKERFVITTLSNGNVSLLTNMAKRAGLPWDCVISAELFHHYKPDAEAYLGCADLLGVSTGATHARRRPPRRPARGAWCGTEDGIRRAAAGIRPQSATSQVGRRRIRCHRNRFSRPCRPAECLNPRRSVEE